jgi:hypothetical protein
VVSVTDPFSRILGILDRTTDAIWSKILAMFLSVLRK